MPRFRHRNHGGNGSFQINEMMARTGRNLSDDQRLQLHQHLSGPLMKDLGDWFDAQFGEKTVEPNTGLGQAIKYMCNHWDALTLFLHVPGAPLDNNICERALKKAILNRKNALFY